MTRRLDGPLLNTARATPPTQEAPPGESVRPQPVGRRRLKGSEKVSERDRKPSVSAASEEADVAELDARVAAGARSIDDALNDLVMPRLSEPGILRRSVPILQHFVSEIIPRLDGGEQLKILATSLMRDEIDRHRELLGRLQGRGDV
ncbi:hypothetical protein [Nitratireductor pacificus]|uniref:Uncharacterized protein n=1 Tax=Nitratireductor pacificus pht-3B TaxID=391937 RepID=K2MKD2_9HYPH|nr:hypothetical protein [Nitratireductor pacificus]EKF17682.1 hypothetical protein NA2_16522 [Nitratireductor pacificus pht-3B]